MLIKEQFKTLVFNQLKEIINEIKCVNLEWNSFNVKWLIKNTNGGYKYLSEIYNRCI